MPSRKLNSQESRALRVATPDGKCPLCRVGGTDAKIMLGPVEIGVCQNCSGALLHTLSFARMATGILKRWRW
jgi:hypothetical protein